MTKIDLEAALQAIKPESKAAQMRKVMPIIESQLKAGVSAQAMLDVLNTQGLELSMATFRSYLYRYRQALKQEGIKPSALKENEAQPVETTRKELEFVSYDKDTEAASLMIMSPSELSRMMNPGDDVNAAEMARYESAGRKRREQKLQS